MNGGLSVATVIRRCGQLSLIKHGDKYYLAKGRDIIAIVRIEDLACLGLSASPRIMVN